MNINNSILTNNIAERYSRTTSENLWSEVDDGFGGAISNYGTLNINNSIINNNNAKGYYVSGFFGYYSNGLGGAIYNKHGILNLKNTQLTNNTANNDGGAIYSENNFNNNNHDDITDCIISNNTAGDNGGAIYNHNILSITKSTLQNNSARWGGAIYNDNSTLNLTKSEFYDNKATNSGGAIYNSHGKYLKIENNTFSYNTASNGGVFYNYYGKNVKIENNKFSYNSASTGSIVYSDSVEETDEIEKEGTFIPGHYLIEEGIYKYGPDGRPIYIPEYYEGRTYKTILHGVNMSIKNNVIMNNTSDSTIPIITHGKNITIENNTGQFTLKSSTIYINSSDVDITNNIFSQTNVLIKVNSIKGIIGETITLTATLKDIDNMPVNGGNLAFKLNGKTLRSDGRFDSKAGTMKFSVKNGLVTYTIKADLYLRNAKNLVAIYSGTSKFFESTSPLVTAQIQKRNAQVTVTTTPTRAKQYETLTFKITAKDVTKNGKNNTLIYTNTKVMLKVNGVTLKDNNEKPVYVTLDKNAQATYKYTIPAGTGGITASKAQRNYKVDAIFVGDNYYPGTRNTTQFQVERSPTTVTIQEVKVVTKTNTLSVKSTLKDYKGNNLIGTNKVTIKINGKNYIDPKNSKTKYWSVKNGIVNLSGIQVDPKTTIKRVMLVTGERQAYTEGRAETINIIRT